MLFIPCIILTINHIHQHIHIIGLQTVRKFWKLLHVSAPKHHPRGVSNTKEYKHQYVSLGNTMPSSKIFKSIKIGTFIWNVKYKITALLTLVIIILTRSGPQSSVCFHYIQCKYTNIWVHAVRSNRIYSQRREPACIVPEGAVFDNPWVWLLGAETYRSYLKIMYF